MNIVYEENYICNIYDLMFNGYKLKDMNLF